jgi:hypothetical protein
MPTTTQPVPAKMLPFLALAERRGLLVRESDDADGMGSLLVRAWRIGADPARTYVSHLVFAYWTESSRGGRTAFYLYRTDTHKSRKITRREAGTWLSVLGRQHGEAS